jgi:uncharacterized protein YqeY
MSLEKQIYADMVSAMKTSDILKRDTLRLLMSEIKKERVDSRKEPTDEDVMKIIKNGLKKRQDSIELFKQGKREDLVEQAQAEIKILEIYLPKQMAKEELEKILSDIITKLGATSPKDTGRIMKEVMANYGSQVDGKLVQQIVSSKLNITK